MNTTSSRAGHWIGTLGLCTVLALGWVSGCASPKAVQAPDVPVAAAPSGAPAETNDVAKAKTEELAPAVAETPADEGARGVVEADDAAPAADAGSQTNLDLDVSVPEMTGTDTNVAAGGYVDPARLADDASAYPHIELLTEALIDIRKFYVEDKSYRDITLGAIHGMLESLDPHSSFLEAEEYGEMQEDTAGKFSGIGINIGLKDGLLTVIAPIEDTPGFRAGLQSGDRILEIDSEKTPGMDLRDAVKRLRGAKGTKVSLTVQGLEDDSPRTVAIVRDDIVVPSVKGGRILRDGIGYIRITQFARPTADMLQEQLDLLQKEHLNALVLDLRNNPGGLLKSAVDVAQKFLKPGAVIVTTRGRPGVQDEVITRGAGKTHLTDFPMAILVNGGSASASEIVAGALKDHKRAVIVGTKSFGKASVQSVIPMAADTNMAIRLTIAYYYTPNGNLIHEKGIAPDIDVELSPDEWRGVLTHRAQVESPGMFSEEEKQKYADAVDTQLERAVDLLQAIKIFK
ncbi:MAG: S41 family peptidase [Lentisphaerae bacterium]|nr:S41 family peptidase [Lentisphaerota bacterium]